MAKIIISGSRKNGVKPIKDTPFDKFDRPVVVIIPNLADEDRPCPECHGPRRTRVESIRVDLANEYDGETPASVYVHCDDPGCGYGYYRPYIVRVMRPDSIMGPSNPTKIEGDDPGSTCPHCGEAAKLRRCYVCGAEAWLVDCGHYPQPRPIAAGRADGSDLEHDYCEYCAAHV